ncbi:MAG: methyltransferase family protein [Bryobacteraceae bacterium]
MLNWLYGRHLPLWLGAIVHIVGVSVVHAAIPWALSLLAARHGWEAGAPGSWNLVGLIPVAAGLFIIVWSVRAHFTASPEGWRLEKTPHYPTPAYLLSRGPYKYSRNPIYLAEGTIWLGWMLFYGSFAVLGVFALGSLLLGPIVVRREERGLEARFGDVYREYARNTPRWLGKAKAPPISS